MKRAEWVIQLGIILIMILCALMVNKLYASDLGVMGETYPIAEMDFLDFIQSRIASLQKNGQWQSLQDRMQKEAVQYRDRPKKAEGITRAMETKSWQFDPSIVLDHDVTTPDGKRIAAAGTRVNPLIYVSLSKTLIFYNADDNEQVQWVIAQDKKLKGRDKLILVNGSLLAQEKQSRKPVYFDQAGKLLARFGITHVPAMVTQEGTLLRITEVKP